MQHPKDVKGSDRPLPRNDGKFVLDGKRVEFSDYGGSSKKVTTTDVHTLQIESMGNAQGRIWDTQQSMVDRLDKIDSEIRIMFKIVSENHLALMKIEKRIAIMQEKINGID